MPSLGPFYAGDVAILEAGFYGWFPNESPLTGAPDLAYAWIGPSEMYDTTIMLASGGGGVSGNKANNTLVSFQDPDYGPIWIDYTGNSAFWGIALTPALLNGPSFGFILQLAQTLLPDAFESDRTLFTQFNSGAGLGIPSNATNIVLSVGVLFAIADPGENQLSVDAVRLIVTDYTLPASSGNRNLLLMGCG